MIAFFSAVHFYLSLCAKVYGINVLALRQSIRGDLNNHQRSPWKSTYFQIVPEYPFNSAYLWKGDKLLPLVTLTSGLLTHIFQAVCSRKILRLGLITERQHIANTQYEEVTMVECTHFHRAASRSHIVLMVQELVRKWCLLLTLLMVGCPSASLFLLSQSRWSTPALRATYLWSPWRQ